MQFWEPQSWQTKSCEQLAQYPDMEHVTRIVNQLSQLPSLVTSPEVDNLKQQIAQASRGERFLLQGGDCAERFADCNSVTITNKFKIMLQMSLVLLHGLRKPITRIGRIAGQYAKPRSSDTETIGGHSLPSYRGDLINRPEFTAEARVPDPELMIQGYSHSAITLNYLRALVDSGFADLQHSEFWDIDFVHHAPQVREYKQLLSSVIDSLDFINTIDGINANSLDRVDFFTSHEALHLYYEQALTRRMPNGKWYNLSTHFPWVGMRTAKPNSAHIEYLRGIANPIGIKIGPNINNDWLFQMLDVLNPENEAGRITLITRVGRNNVRRILPQLIDAVQCRDYQVNWSCDPMHGNTQKTKNGFKTRSFDDIIGELVLTTELHQQMNSILGGVHFELTGEDVTECIGGARGLNENDLKRAYKSLVDPRLNYEQALEMTLLIAKHKTAKELSLENTPCLI